MKNSRPACRPARKAESYTEGLGVLFKHIMKRLGCWVLAGVFAVTLCGTAQAQWKWRDKGGVMHMSDIPPPSDIPEKDILNRPASAKARAAATPASAPASASVPAAPAKQATDPELEARIKRMEAEKAAQQKREDEKVAAGKAENCARARESLRTLESGIRIARTNEKGEREFYDDKQRADETQRVRSVIASDCR